MAQAHFNKFDIGMEPTLMMLINFGKANNINFHIQDVIVKN